jgi:hypothetical protein
MGSKTLRALVVAIVIVGLMAVAVPVCLESACSASSSAASTVPSHMSAPHALMSLVAGTCNMATVLLAVPDTILPSGGSVLLALFAAAVALSAIAALRPEWRFGRTSIVSETSLPPPACLQGVRLLI